jgi:hypothetical protein
MSTFRLLDLPTELRLLIYEHITPTAQQRSFQLSPQGFIFPSPATLTTRYLPVALLRTSKLIHREAGPILAAKLASLRTEPLYLCLDAGVLNKFFDPTAPLSQRIQPYTNVHERRKLLEHNRRCQSQSCHTCHKRSLFSALADVLLHRQPRATLLTVERSQSPRSPYAIGDLCTVLRREEHWTRIPKPVHLHFRSSEVAPWQRGATSEFPRGLDREWLGAVIHGSTWLGTSFMEKDNVKTPRRDRRDDLLRMIMEGDNEIRAVGQWDLKVLK